jgi:apolipoprotein N-acyltransferase
MLNIEKLCCIFNHFKTLRALVTFIFYFSFFCRLTRKACVQNKTKQGKKKWKYVVSTQNTNIQQTAKWPQKRKWSKSKDTKHQEKMYFDKEHNVEDDIVSYTDNIF